MALAIILFVGGAVIFTWLFLWSRQKQALNQSAGIESLMQHVPSAASEDAVLVSREHGQLVYINEPARRLLNMNGGSPNLEYIAQMAQPSDSFLQLLSHEGQSSFQLGARWVEASSHRIPAGQETRTVVVMRELGANTTNPDALDLSLAMSVINQIGEMVNASLSIEQVLGALLNIVSGAVPADAGEICLWDEHSGVLYPRGWMGNAAYVLALSEAGGMYQLGEGITGWIAKHRRPALVEDTNSRTAITPKLAAWPYRSFVGVPLVLGERLIGTFEFASAAPFHFGQKDLALLQAVSKQIATSVYNAQLYTEQSRHIDNMASLQQVLQQDEDADYVHEVYHSLNERMARLVGADMCGILLYNEARQALLPELPFYGVPDQIARSYFIPLPSGSPQREIWENQQYWISNDVTDEPMVETLGLMPMVAMTGVFNTTLVPLVAGENRIGIVQVSNKKADGGFTLRDIQNLRILTAQAAIVVDNLRIYQRDQSREAESLGLQEISHALSAFSREEEFYAQLNRRIAQLMNVSMCGILLYDQAQHALKARLPFYGVSDELVRVYQINLEPGSALHDIWMEVDLWYTNNVNADRVVIEAGLETLASAIGVKQTMIALLSLGDRRLGVVQASNKLNGEVFTDRDARMLSIFATQAAALIENARLYREMQRRADEAELLRDQADGLRRIAELAGAIITAEEPFTPVLEEIARVTGSPLVFINLLEQNSSKLVTYPRYVYGLELDESIVQDTYGQGFENSVAISQRPFWSNVVATDERVLFSYRFISKKVGIQRALLSPLVVGDRSLGEIGVANRPDLAYSDEDSNLLSSIALQIAAVLDRITLYQSAGENLSHRVRELDAISRVSNELTLTLDLERILNVIRQEAARATGADGSTIALLKPSTEWKDVSDPEMNWRLGESTRMPAHLADIEREAVLSGADPFIVRDYDESDLEAWPPHARSALAAAFHYADEVVGVVHLYHTQPYTFDTRALEFIMTLASKAALGYANAIRYDEQIARSAQLRRRVEQLNQIFELGQMLQSNTDASMMLEAIAYSIQNSGGYDVVVILLADENQPALRRVAQAGLPLEVFEKSKKHRLPLERFEALRQEKYRISESYFYSVEEREAWAKSGDLAALSTAFEGKRLIVAHDAGGWHEGDMLLVPLNSSANALIGLIVLDGPQDNARPVRNSVEVLEIFAHHASTTIENTRLYLGSIASAEQEARLNEVMETITRSLDIQEVLQSVARGMSRLVPFSHMTFALFDPERESFDIHQVSIQVDGTPVMIQESWPGLAQTALGRSFDDGQDYIYTVEDDGSFRNYIDLHAAYERGARAAVVVPLVAGGQRMGVLQLSGNLEHGFDFNEFRPLIKRMTNLAAVAIQNARLFQQAVNLRLFNESVFQSIQQGIIVLDNSGRIISINDFMSRHYDWDLETAIGQDLFAYRPELIPLLLTNVRAALETAAPQTRIGQRSTQDERALVRNFYLYPLGDTTNIRGLVLMVEDVTERSQLEQDLEVRANQLAVLTEISSRITASLDYTEVIALALGEMDRIIGYDTMTFWLRKGDYLVLEGAKDYEDETIPVGVNVKIESHERISQVVNRQRVLRIGKLTQGRGRLPGENNAQSWMGVPLVNQGHVVGMIAFTRSEPDFYDEQAEQASFAFANQVAVALANANLFREAERRTQRLSLLNRVSVALGQSLDSEDILEIGLREIAQALHIEHAIALMFERDLQVGRVVVEHPRGDMPPDQLIDLKDNPTYHIIRRSAKPLIIENLLEHEDPEIRRELVPRGLTAYALIPMSIGGQVIGAFELEVFNGARIFDPEQIDLGRIIANQAAIAIQNTSLLEQTLVRSRELETLLEAAQATSVSLDLKQVYRSVVDLMLQALEMDDCMLMMWNDIDRAAEVQVDISRSNDPERITPLGTIFDLSSYPAKLQSLERSEIIVINGESSDHFPKENAEMRRAGDSAYLLVPLVVRDHAIGLIQLELRAEQRTFTHREFRLAQALASQAATAIENARLSTETATRVEEMYTLNDLSQAVSATMNIDEMIDVVRTRLPGIADTEELYLALYDADDEMITFPLALHRGQTYEIPPRKLNDDEVSFVIRNRRLLTIGSDYFSADELRRSLGISSGEGDVKSYMGVPLASGQDVVGVLALRDTQRTRAFGVNASGLLTTIGSQLGAAIQNARLFDQLSALNKNLEGLVDSRTRELAQERDRIDALYRITAELARTLDLERVLNRALEMVAGAVNAYDGVIFQLEPANDHLRARATLKPVDSGSGVHPAEELASWLVNQHSERVVVVDELMGYPRWDASLPGASEWRSALAVVLEVNDDIHGVMILFGQEPAAFTTPHVKLVVAAANQVAAAINNSDLYYLIRDQAERLGKLVLAEQEEAEKSNAILEGIADGVMLADARGQIVRFNSAAERILELPRESVLGQPVSKVIGVQGGLASRWLHNISDWSQSPDVYKPGHFLSEQVEIGSKVVNLRLSPVHIDNQFLGTVLVFRDITKEVEVERLKSEFISNVSHELRTPLTPIKGFTDLMLLGAAGDISSQQDYFLKTIKSHTNRLERLVNDLLNISKIDDSRSSLQFEAVALGEVLEEAVSTIGSRAEHKAKNLNVSLSISPDLPSIKADLNKTRQIFENIIDNAFNYTYAGGSIEIEARVHDDHDQILVSVKDTGIGIPDEFRDRIWERFVRNDDSALVMDVAGTGLGLPIVKQLVELHHGEVWFESQPGKGTTFFILLPLNQPADAVYR